MTFKVQRDKQSYIILPFGDGQFLPLLCRVIDKDVKMSIFFRGFFTLEKLYKNILFYL